MIISNSGTVIDDTDESVRTELVFENTLVRNNRNGISTSKSGHCYLKIFNSSFEQNLSRGIYLECCNVTTHITFSTFRSSAVSLSGVSDKFEVSTRFCVTKQSLMARISKCAKMTCFLYTALLRL